MLNVSTVWTALVVGLLLGCCGGMFILALAVAAGRADRNLERLQMQKGGE